MIEDLLENSDAFAELPEELRKPILDLMLSAYEAGHKAGYALGMRSVTQPLGFIGAALKLSKQGGMA